MLTVFLANVVAAAAVFAIVFAVVSAVYGFVYWLMSLVTFKHQPERYTYDSEGNVKDNFDA